MLLISYIYVKDVFPIFPSIINYRQDSLNHIEVIIAFRLSLLYFYILS